jgi:hypothetical protein
MPCSNLDLLRQNPQFARFADYLAQLPPDALACIVEEDSIRCWAEGGWTDGLILACAGHHSEQHFAGEYVGNDFIELRRLLGAPVLMAACRAVCASALAASALDLDR